MRTLVFVLVCLSVCFSLSLPALAQSEGFDATYRREATGSIEIGRIDVSPALRSKAEQLGEAELARLTGYLREVLVTTLVAADWHGVAAQETVLDVTLVDVVPSRPTMTQIQNMDMAHYSAEASGGAELTAELRDAGGRLVANYHFAWYNPETAGADSGIWTDTRTAFARFSQDLADSLGDAPMPRSSGS